MLMEVGEKERLWDPIAFNEGFGGEASAGKRAGFAVDAK